MNPLDQDTFETIAALLREGICVCDAQTGAILYVTPRHVALWQDCSDQPPDSLEALLTVVHPDDRDQVVAAARTLRESGKPFDLEYRVVRENPLCWRRAQGRVLTRQAGLPDRMLLLTEDITQEQEELLRLQQSQRLQTLGTMTSGIAHDFNNMLTAIQGYAALLLSEIAPHSQAADDVQTIMRSAQQATDLVRQLLAFAREGPSIAPAPVALNTVLQDVVSLLQRTIDKRIQIESTLSDNLPPVRGLASQLHQAVLNLCLNARDAMVQGGHLHITSRLSSATEMASAGLEATTAYVCFCISDTGPGLAPQVLEHLFRPFTTTKAEGRGLGLAIVAAVVQNHQGHIRVETSDRGTCFTVYLPVCVTPPATPEPTVCAAAPLASLWRPQGEQILVVDDEELVRAFLQRALEEAGYQVLLAATGQQAVLLYEQHAESVALVFLDLSMPGWSGQQTYQRLRAINPLVPVVVITGYGENGMVEELRAAGIRGFLHKPFMPETVLTLARSLLEPGGAPMPLTESAHD